MAVRQDATRRRGDARVRRTRRRASTLSVESFSEAARGRRGSATGATGEAGENSPTRTPEARKRRTSERGAIESSRERARETNELVDVVADEAWIDPSNARCRRGRSVDRPIRRGATDGGCQQRRADRYASRAIESEHSRRNERYE